MPITGLTPAWAGSTALDPTGHIVHEAHPRMGGEHECIRAAQLFRRGSPPHGRGARGVAGVCGGCGGLTPAWAGSTLLWWW